MKLCNVSVDDPALVGAVLAHSERLADGHRLAKGTVIDAEIARRLAADGLSKVTVAVLEPGDILEDAAADRIGRAVCGGGLEARSVGTGRVNLHAKAAGVVLVDADTINACNAVHPSLTIATLAHFRRVAAGDMVATVKIIAFAVPADTVEECAALADAHPLSVAQFRASLTAHLIQTMLPSVKASVLDKTVRVTAERFESLGITMSGEARCDHEADRLAEQLDHAVRGKSDLVVVFGASAVCDDEDVIPRAIRLAGGQVIHVGMPVDPGNLLVFGQVGMTTVIGAPGCARSPKRNGFDWVLERWLAGITITAQMIRRMGVGGLLSEIDSRPQPRGLSSDDA